MSWIKSTIILLVICLCFVVTGYADGTYSKEDIYTSGQTVYFGCYEQDNDLTNGKELIEWIVIGYSYTHDRVLMYSKYGLDAGPYNESGEIVKWKDSTLYAWLNNEFYNEAFVDEEKSFIIEVSLPGDQDLLFSLKKNPQVVPTDYALARGASELNHYGWYWVRPTFDEQELYRVSVLGKVGTFKSPEVETATIRPLLYIDPSKLLPDSLKLRNGVEEAEWFCMSCGKIGDDGNFCSNCGTARSLLLTCSNCNTVYIVNDKNLYCGKCGAALPTEE